MSSKPTEPRAIASQLVLRFTLAAALLLCCGLGVLYWIVVRHAFEEDNAVLADKISAVRADLHEAGPNLLQQELQTPRAGEHSAYSVRILAAGNRVVAETAGMSRILPVTIFPQAQDVDHPGLLMKDVRAVGRLYSLGSADAETGGERYTIQVAQDRSADERFMREFGALLAAVLVLGVLASALIARTVTNRGLRPLAEMTRSLKRIGPNRLHERLMPAGWPHELQPLAIAFDEMLERLQDSFRRLSQFSADLAHELRTPVANIRGESEVALTRSRTPEEYREVIGSVVGECEKLSGLIDNLLFLARAEAAESNLQRAVFDGRTAIEKVALYYEPIAEERHVAVRCEGGGEVYADSMLFSRAVSNLLENALRFTSDGGEIVISVTTSPAESEVAVSDTGSGISAQHLPRIFDRFYRADSSRSSEGTGLGLALVKSIAELHGGSARAMSEEGRGTRVTLCFPNAPT